MAEMKYSDRIITEPKPLPPEIKAKLDAERGKRKSTIQSTHVMTVDDDILKGFFYVDCNWLWKGAAEDTAEDPHAHSFDEVIGFIGSNREDPHDLGGEIDIWLNGEKKVLTKSCLIFIRAGTPHCPILFKRIDKPVFFLTMSTATKYDRTTQQGKDLKPVKTTDPALPPYSIVTETKARFSVAATGSDTPPPAPRDPRLKSTRILHIEDDIVKGAFYVDFVWIWEGVGGAPATEHTHEWNELIAMAGADPEHPHDLGGPMSIVLGDENHIITKSSLVCIPAGLKHCPWKFLDIKKPTLVFSAGPQGMYSGSHKK
jgi:hypothetical protein